MRIFTIMLKEIKEIFYNKQVLMLMILLPIVLIGILGFAFSSTSDIKLGYIKVIYTDEGDRILSQSFNIFIKETDKMGVKFVEIKDVDKGISEIEKRKYDGYVFLKGKDITFYKNENGDIKAEIAASMIDSFIDTFKGMTAIASQNPAFLKNSGDINLNKEFVKITSIDRKVKQTSFDYYSVTMLTLIILYGAMSGVFSIDMERTKKTGARILASPVKKYEILMGKVLGVTFSTFIQALIIVIFSKYVFGANWGKDIVTIFVIIISEIILVVGLGVSMGFIIKNGAMAQGLLNGIIPFIAFLGGSYYPVKEMGSQFIEKLSNYSPITWTNAAIFNVILGSNYQYVPKALMVNLIPAAFFIVLSAYLFRREAF
ncbi:ABC transporter permease [Caldanaerobacter sp.]|uniref:ABC transporter permease n=1 Tax=Caldanaerobacter sp. TaxID=2930036 RepID=UPI003C7681E6